ncbi:MAG: hypothetical protein J0H09_06595, partial [Burkholderiales bacterium]|nr:hypothetical protein [Burkholderiales bacterium]
ARRRPLRAERHQAFLAVLDFIQGLNDVVRRKRVDEHTAEREFVDMVTRQALEIFDDAPPTLICELAALRGRSPDKVAITKQVNRFKKGYKPPSM